MCCNNAKWKREVVPDHKFHFVDVQQFRDESCFTRLRYAWQYLLVIKSFLVYASDIYTAISMLAFKRWAGDFLEKTKSHSESSNTLKIPFSIGRWIFIGCIIFSFLLLAWEARKSRRIIKSGDISYAYTNVMANNYYSMKSYDHFCFFCHINNSRKTKDEFAFFVFFTFKGWKRLLLADAPRQVINALALYSFGKAYNFTTDWSQYVQGSWATAGVLITMIFTVVMWAGSFVLLLIAAFMYVPLLCYIQGNLKEYCCHKIDKRIADIIKKRTRKRLLKEQELARKEAAGDFRHKRKGSQPTDLVKPTLPKIDLDDDRYGGSDVGSINKDPSYFNMPPSSHMYPPSNGWKQGGYQDNGYEASIHSMDKLYSYDHTPDQPYVPPYAQSKAPSYRSQVSLHDSQPRTPGWDNQPAPSMPNMPDAYATVDHHLRHATSQSDLQSARAPAPSSIVDGASTYQQPSRQRLLDNVNRNQTEEEIMFGDSYAYSASPQRGDVRGGQQAYQQHDERRPESELVDLEAYYSTSPTRDAYPQSYYQQNHQQTPRR